MSTAHIIATALMIGMHGVAAYTSPLLVDAVFALGKLGRLERFSPAIRRSSLRLMLFGGAMSLACNVMAGTNLGQRIHGVLVVVVMVWIESHAARLANHGRAASAVIVAESEANMPVAAAREAAASETAAAVAAAEQQLRAALAAEMANVVAEAERVVREAMAAEMAMATRPVAKPRMAKAATAATTSRAGSARAAAASLADARAASGQASGQASVAVAAVLADNPAMTTHEVAALAGVSTRTVRRVRRQLAMAS
jgi:hypothetical protein